MTDTHIDLETWECATDSRVTLKKYNARGELTDEMIGAHRKFHLTPAERRINQDRAADESLDPFSNGLLVPVRLIEGHEDTAQIASNPNTMSEVELKALFSTHPKTFEKKVGEITNPITLNRLIELSNEVDATVRQVVLVQGRLEQVQPSLVGEVTTIPTSTPGVQRAG